MIVEKAIDMARQMDLPILGMVENMAYFHCPDNGKDYKIFGESHLDEVAARHHLPVLGRLPIDPALAAACDAGGVESGHRPMAGQGPGNDRSPGGQTRRLSAPQQFLALGGEPVDL